jgi:hypothetical protein
VSVYGFSSHQTAPDEGLGPNKVHDQALPGRGKLSKSQFRRLSNARCQKWRIPEHSDDLGGRDWPAFSQLDDAAQQAFWEALSIPEEERKEALHT